MDRTQALAALSALANETRLDLIRLLVPAGPQGLPAGRIAQALGLSASRLSFHLAAMEAAGLIRSRRASRHVIYAACPGALGGLMAYLLRDCCQAHPEVQAHCLHPGDSEGTGAEEGEGDRSAPSGFGSGAGRVKTWPG